MCQNCADRTGDPRKAALQPIFTVTWMTQKQAVQMNKALETGDGPTINLEQSVTLSPDEAKAAMDAKEDDPLVFRFALEKTIVYLN